MDYRELKERYDFLKSGKTTEARDFPRFRSSRAKLTKAIDSLKKGTVEAFLIRSTSDSFSTQYSYHIEVFSEEKDRLKSKCSPATNAGYMNGQGLWSFGNNYPFLKDDLFYFEGARGKYESIDSVKLKIMDIYKDKNEIQVLIANTLGKRKTIEAFLSN